ncbi:inorganic triphosphatase [Shewanella litorisediminis]|uniref:CYTH domain-containing protein n=1 Tax=Shewanella litorisediminis TaxID=1173586 RepID=A0ABX7G116_9GAMM|nr:CYTH domain-containing protein [Shewanella litorisediminis]MCL2918884.1 CYTH domain-containing protein [Shewanella litorisediminis]QRH00957.1 CYTH domain-containing protein [Shewanella litorisediminis]
MEAEIELKLFFLPEYKDSLIQALNNRFTHSIRDDAKLSNGYFDTPDMQLRQWDMGLRVRGRNGKREQTIKTAGKVVGGIHTRPEYNVDIEADSPVLSLFPEHIWPEGANLNETQAELACIFNTDFRRLTWLVEEGRNRIEIALDQGLICAAGNEEPLCELEFELMAGEPLALLDLAAELANTIPLRLGKASKAQRGYRLAGMATKAAPQALETIPLDPDDSAEHALTTLLETALERWQLLEDLLGQSVDDPNGSASLWLRMRTCIGLLEASCRQFTLLTPELEAGFNDIRQAFGFVDELIALTFIAENRDSLLGRRKDALHWQQEAQARLGAQPSTERLQALWRMPAYGRVQLALVRILMSPKSMAETGLRQVADALQQASRESIQGLMPEQGSESPRACDFLRLGSALDEALLVGLAYGELYSSDARHQYRAPWQDLRRGIDTLRAYVLLGELAGPATEMQEWLDDKSLSLMHALEQSRRSALTQLPYWQT